MISCSTAGPAGFGPRWSRGRYRGGWRERSLLPRPGRREAYLVGSVRDVTRLQEGGGAAGGPPGRPDDLTTLPETTGYTTDLRAIVSSVKRTIRKR